MSWLWWTVGIIAFLVWSYVCAYIGGGICISNFKADLLDKLNCGVLSEGSIREYLLDNRKEMQRCLMLPI